VTPCSLVGGYKRFGRTYCLCLQVICSSKMLKTTDKTAWCHNPEDHDPQMPYIVFILFTKGNCLNEQSARLDELVTTHLNYAFVLYILRMFLLAECFLMCVNQHNYKNYKHKKYNLICKHPVCY
jgi:hypothetical protein